MNKDHLLLLGFGAIGAVISWFVVIGLMEGTRDIGDTFDVRSTAYLKGDKPANRRSERSVTRVNNTARTAPPSRSRERSFEPATITSRAVQPTVSDAIPAARPLPQTPLTNTSRETSQHGLALDKQTSVDMLSSPATDPQLVHADSDADIQAVRQQQRVADTLVDPRVGSLEPLPTSGMHNALVTPQAALTTPTAPSSQGQPVSPQAMSGLAGSNRPTRLPAVAGVPARPPEPVHAMDVALLLAACDAIKADRVSVEILFRESSAAIKGRSLLALDSLVQAYRRCHSAATIVVSHHVDGKRDATDTLRQRRQDEIKYYLLQHGVTQTDVSYP